MISAMSMTLAPALDARAPGLPAHPGGQPIAWRVEAATVPYEYALAVMTAPAAPVAEGSAGEPAPPPRPPPRHPARTSPHAQTTPHTRRPLYPARPGAAAHPPRA